MEIPVGCTGNQRKRSTTAFTLIEMMVVLVIVGILASLAMVQFNTYREQAKLRQSAQKVFQIFSWAKLQSEKQGDTLLIQFAMPKIYVIRDRNGNGIIDPNEDTLLSDSVENTVQLVSPTVGPVDVAGTITSGFADGPAGTCGPGICCDRTGSPTSPSWKNAIVGICMRSMPAMPSLLEDGAIFLGSTKSSVVENWAIVMNHTVSSNQSLWTSSNVPAAAADWRRVR